MKFTKMPVIHGGHSVLDNHSPKHCGLPPERYEKDFFLKNCGMCPARKYCYHIEIPKTFAEKLELLKTIYCCYLTVANQRNVSPMGFVVHLPVPVLFRTYLLEHYVVSEFEKTNVCMEPQDFAVFAAIANNFSKEREGKSVFGVEIDFIPQEFRDNQEMNTYLTHLPPKTFIIGSVHFVSIGSQIFRVGRQGNDLVNAEKYIENYDAENFWLNILKATLELVKSYDIHILGHPFVFEKHLPFCPVTSKTENLFEEITKIVAEKNIIVELNSSGFAKGIHKEDPYLPIHWVKMLQKHHVRFTIGDDSHSQLQIGQGYEELKVFMEKCNIDVIYIPILEVWEPIYF